MTDHADLSRRLALAIGWPENLVDVRGTAVLVWWRYLWTLFDYRDPLVIWPIAERYNCFPVRGVWSKKWTCPTDLFDESECDTAAEAVARAVVGARK